MFFKFAVLFSSLIGCFLDTAFTSSSDVSVSGGGSTSASEKDEFGNVCSFQEAFSGPRQAVVVIRGPNPQLNTISGTVVFTQERCGGPVYINGSISGTALTPGNHGWHIHEKGDLTDGCTSTLLHFNPFNQAHGPPNSFIRHVGDLGNILAGANNVAVISQTDFFISLFGFNSIIGRGLVIHAAPDDFVTQPTGNSGGRIGCGVIGFR